MKKLEGYLTRYMLENGMWESVQTPNKVHESELEDGTPRITIMWEEGPEATPTEVEMTIYEPKAIVMMREAKLNYDLEPEYPEKDH